MSLVALFISACNQGGKYPGFTTENGLTYKIHKAGGDTQVARKGDVMIVHMVYRTMNDSNFSGAQSTQSFEIPMLDATYKGDVFDALAMMHPGDSITFIMNSDSFFVKTVGAPRPEFLDSGSTFFLDITMDSIKTKAQVEAEAKRINEEMKMKAEQALNTYIAANDLNIGMDESGIYFMETKKGTGKAPQDGDFIETDLVATALTGGKFIDTYEEGKPYDLQVGTGQLGVGFEHAIKKMRAGGKATVIVPSDLAFGESGVQGFIPPYSPVVYEIYIRKVMTKAEMDAKREAEAKKAAAEAKKLESEEQAKINAYLKANNITAQPTASGLIYIEEVPGTGTQAVNGNKVKVHYTGYLLDGKKFDSSVDRGEPFEFVLGQHQVIQGWDEGIAMMRVGGKAKLIIPSRIAYGPKGTGPIPPYAPLVFEVELIEVSE
jgi:FKBP-type peptidyl-prolyl cis-trans isomerase